MSDFILQAFSFTFIYICESYVDYMAFSYLKKRTILVALLICIFIFILDFLIPPGTAIGALYLASITIIYRQPKKVIILFATMTSFLILLNVLIFQHLIFDWSVYGDRIISVVGIWFSALVAVRYRKLNEMHEVFKKKKLKEIEEMLYITNHKVRHPVSEIIGLSNLIHEKGTQADIDYNEIVNHIKKPAMELDNFTQELSQFLNEIESWEQSKEVKNFVNG